MSKPSEKSIGRDELVAYLAEFLAVDAGPDACPNGLQVEGRTEIRRIVTGVSACAELFERAVEFDADAVLVHHGIFWQGDSPVLTGFQHGRVKPLIQADLNLLAYHLPLDRHPTLGNNALAAEAFGLIDIGPFGIYEGQPVGFRGRLAESVSIDRVEKTCREIFGQSPIAFKFGPRLVGSMAIVSGAGGRLFYEAISEEIDLFLTGEADEWTMNVARESATHFLAAGHYATERLGIRALGEHLSSRFGLEAKFVDIPNPV